MKPFLFIILLTISTRIASQTILQYVNPLIGTAPATTESSKRHGSGSEEKGQTYPATGRPFGMTQWTPETRTSEEKCVSPYYYNDKYITGFRGSHWMSGSCAQDYGSASIMPFTSGKPDTITRPPVSKYNHKNETSSPAYYKVVLDNFDITTEMTGSIRSGILRFTFPGKNNSYVLIRMNSDRKKGNIWIDKQRNEIVGYNPVFRLYQGSGQPAGFNGYFVFRFDKPFEMVPLLQTSQQIVLKFGNEIVVNVKAGTSFTSIDAARNNLEKEILNMDVEKLRKASEDTWIQTLGKVQLRGGSPDDKTKFYTALYHCYQLPRIASDFDGSYQGFAQDTLIHKAEGFDYYDDFSMWDTYRALHPLMIILEPKKTLDMVKSLVLKAQQGGWMPIFPAWSSYTAEMIGDHVSTMISDTYLKGITAFDAETAYRYMRQNAFDSPSESEYKDGKGRRALVSYLKYGYIPLEDSVWDAFHKYEQVSRTLEYAFDDYALSGFAKALGKTSDYEVLLKRSSNWRNVFDPQSGYVRGRYADGKWIEPFDPFAKAQYICEGTPAQWTWYVPQDIPALTNAMGGSGRFIERLNDFFEKGYYWHGNEPDHQAAFMFAMAGQPDKTQEWVNKIINDEYSPGPGGLSGNEDAGQMSAWLVFSMMGFYPVCPASNQYVITTPSFDEVKITLADGKFFLITSIGRENNNKYIRVITKNGAVFRNGFLSHDEITSGSRFTFQISARPPVMK